MSQMVESVLLEKGSDVISVRSDAIVRHAAQRMIDTKVGCLIVEEGDAVVGIFTERDLLCRVVGDDKDPNTTAISEVMSRPVISCKPSDDIEKLFKSLSASETRHLLVVDDGVPVGVISLRDISFVLHRADRERQRLEDSGVQYL